MARSSGFSGLVKLVVFVALVYLGFTKGVPWVKEQLGSGGEGGSSKGSSAQSSEDGGSCVRMAIRANETLAAQIGNFAGSNRDVNAWSDLAARVDGQISSAQSECGCGLDSCRKASQAMSELQTLVRNLDDSIRRGGAGALNAARDQVSVQTLLNEAQASARSGN